MTKIEYLLHLYAGKGSIQSRTGKKLNSDDVTPYQPPIRHLGLVSRSSGSENIHPNTRVWRRPRPGVHRLRPLLALVPIGKAYLC